MYAASLIGKNRLTDQTRTMQRTKTVQSRSMVSSQQLISTSIRRLRRHDLVDEMEVELKDGGGTGQVRRQCAC